jgi:hypothetical protein
MPRLNDYGRSGVELRVGHVVRLKATAGPALRYGDVGKIREIRGDRLLVHMGFGAEFWLSRKVIKTVNENEPGDMPGSVRLLSRGGRKGFPCPSPIG